MHTTDRLTEAERAFLDECEAAAATFETILGKASARSSRQILDTLDPVAAILRLCLDPTLQPGLLSLATAGRLDAAWESVALKHEHWALTTVHQRTLIRGKLAHLEELLQARRDAGLI
jgi:hypothetical protein